VEPSPYPLRLCAKSTQQGGTHHDPPQAGPLALLIIVGALLATAFAAAASPRQPGVDPAAQPYLDLARQDLAARLGIAPGRIQVQSVDPRDFSDSSLGLPREGQMYLTVITPGYIITLLAGDEAFAYHAGGGRIAFAG